jgi:hypothetical protein
MFYRLFFLLLFIGLPCSILTIAHPTRILPKSKATLPVKKTEIQPAIMLTPYGYRTSEEIAPKKVRDHSNPIQRIHPVVWTAMFALAAIGAAYWLSDEKEKDCIRHGKTGNTSH